VEIEARELDRVHRELYRVISRNNREGKNL
jgi:hypothetical protein